MFKKKTNKYNAKRTFSEIMHRAFDSGDEREYAEHLYEREQKGEIDDLKFQQSIDLGRGVKLRVDFTYIEHCCSMSVEVPQLVYDEFKGFSTDIWKLKKRIWSLGAGPGILFVTYKRGKGWRRTYSREEIIPVGFDPLHPDAPRRMEKLAVLIGSWKPKSKKQIKAKTAAIELIEKEMDNG